MNSVRVAIARLPENWYFSRAGSRPYNSAYASELLSFFRSQCVEAKVFDFWLDPELEISEIVDYSDLVIVPDHQPNAMSRFLGRFSFNLKQQSSSLPIVLYGITQAYAESVLRQGICDYVALGDEPILLELIHNLQDDRVNSVNGLAHLEEGKFRTNLPVPYLNSLDSLPFPIPYHLGGGASRNAVMEVITSRGCYANCAFCHVNTDRKLVRDYRWRAMSSERVVDLFSTLSKRHGIRYFLLKDLDFVGTSPERAISIAQGIVDAGLDIRFAVYSRAPDVLKVKDDLPLLHKSGLRQWFVGLESFDEQTLSAKYLKGARVSENFDAVDALTAAGIIVGTGFIALTPETTLDQFESNLKTALKMVEPNPLMFRSTNYFLDGFLAYYDQSPLYQTFSSKFGTSTDSHLKGEVFALREIRHYNWPHDRPIPQFVDKRAVIAASLTKIVAHEMLKKAMQVTVRLSDLLRDKRKEEVAPILAWEEKFNPFQLTLGLKLVSGLRKLLETGQGLDFAFKALLDEMYGAITEHNAEYLPEDLIEPATRRSYEQYFGTI